MTRSMGAIPKVCHLRLINMSQYTGSILRGDLNALLNLLIDGLGSIFCVG